MSGWPGVRAWPVDRYGKTVWYAAYPLMYPGIVVEGESRTAAIDALVDATIAHDSESSNG